MPPKKRKPAAALRIANRLGTLAPAEVRALIHATGRLRKGQLEGSGDDLREGMREQREALAQLSLAAGRAALEEDVKFTLALQRRVQETVRSAAASEPEALLEATLENELQPTGFEGLVGAAPVPRAAPAPVKRDAQEDERRKRALEKQELSRALAEAERAARRLRARSEQLVRTSQQAERRAEAARSAAEQARQTAAQAAARALALRGKS